MSRAGGEAVRVLVVEDEAVVAIDLREGLERLGYAVVDVVASGEAACACCRERRPDLVLMDIQLKGSLDGVEAARQIDRELGIPVVFLTAFADDDTVERAAATGPYGYVLKPFDERELRVTLEVALRRHQRDAGVRRRVGHLRAILEAQGVVGLLVDADGVVQYASRAASELLVEAACAGSPVEAVLGLEAKASRRLRRLLRDSALPGRRLRLDARLGAGPCTVEIELFDDPRDDGDRVLLLHEIRPREESSHPPPGAPAILGRSEAMERVFRMITDLAAVDSPVLIGGETGTGKEVVARAIHRSSRRREGPFMAVNCGALTDELGAGLLFGHRKGAFTGAVADRAGYFEAANGGTLFLDEVGELSPRIQASLLRSIEESAVTRLGESQLRPIDVRVIAATNRDLEQAVAEGSFRRDLFYRLQVVYLELPPLRQRGGDVLLLAEAFLEQIAARLGRPYRGLDAAARRVLTAHDWPGNVRELRNALESAVIRATGPTIGPEDLPVGVSPAQGASEPERIRAALESARGNRKQAARLLGISRATLYRKLRRYDIQR